MDFWGYSYCVITGGLWRLLEITGDHPRDYRTLREITGVTRNYWRLLEITGGYKS